MAQKVLLRSYLIHVTSAALLTLVALVFSGCATQVQFRLADPMVSATDAGEIEPPQVVFSKHNGTHQAKALIAYENPNKSVNNRVNLNCRSVYDVVVRLPENYEYRRLQVLQGKLETVVTAIESGERELQENTRNAARLMNEEARQKVITDCEAIKERIGQHNLQKASTIDATRLAEEDKAIEALVNEISTREQKLRQDDELRDSLPTPTVMDSIVNQIEQWRTELNLLKSRIVALNMMVQNGNEPYPRIIRGTMEVFDATSSTEVNAVPIVFEDQYLEWIRMNNPVTVVACDTYEKPQDAKTAQYRAGLPEYWPRNKVMVVEFTDSSAATQRSAHSGLTISTRVQDSVERQNFFNCKASSLKGDNGYERTYIRSSDGKRMWVFGPDLAPPANLEVWLQDEAGLPVQKLFPATGRTSVEEVFVRQIAGFEGGVFDPVQEAKKSGKIIAVLRLGNIREGSDQRSIHRVYRNEMLRAAERASQ